MLLVIINHKQFERFEFKYTIIITCAICNHFINYLQHADTLNEANNGSTNEYTNIVFDIKIKISSRQSFNYLKDDSQCFISTGKNKNMNKHVETCRTDNLILFSMATLFVKFVNYIQVKKFPQYTHGMSPTEYCVVLVW